MRVFFLYFFLFIAGFTLLGCGSGNKPVPPFGMANELVVVTIEHAEDFHRNPDGHFSGLNYDLVSEFAHELGLGVRFVVTRNTTDALTILSQHQAHFAIGLDQPVVPSSRLRIGPVFKHTHHQIAFNTKKTKPKDLQQLVGKNIEIPAGSIYETQFSKLQQSIPDLTWSAVHLSSSDLLTKLAQGAIDYTVASTSQINKNKHFYLNIDSALELDSTSSQWIFPKFVTPSLLRNARNFFTRIEHDGSLRQLLNSYSGHLEQLNAGDIHFFQKKIGTKLPGFKKYFVQAEKITGIDWRLLAALAYQESHWNPKAKSATGVRGMMMLTQDTAKRMKVTNRLDTRQSIIGGAQYLQLLKNKLPEKVPEPDRTWIALAAYNQGYGHIIDARELATRNALNPDLWVDLKKMLPLLSKKQYFETTKYGKTRGYEAVILTESVRAYYEILKRNHAQ